MEASREERDLIERRECEGIENMVMRENVTYENGAIPGSERNDVRTRHRLWTGSFQARLRGVDHLVTSYRQIG